MRKIRKVPLNPEKYGSEEVPQSKNAENADAKTRKMRLTGLNSVDVSEIFYFFVGSGKGKEESEAPGGGGGGFGFIENPRRGGGFPGEGPRGREGVCSELGNFFGGGGALNIFFGAEMSTKLEMPKRQY